MTADTSASVQPGLSVSAEGYCAVTAVAAGNKAPSAADALIVIEFRKQNCVALQNIGSLAHRIEREPDSFLHAAKSLFRKIIIQPAC